METKQAFQPERAAWRQNLLAEDQRMAAHGRHEAEVERNQVKHQMMEAFRHHASQQSVYVQRAAYAEHLSLFGVAKVETEASRRELTIAQTRFQEASAQQPAEVVR